MAHEITKYDGLVMHRKPAWHGLGVVVEDAPSPLAALDLANLGWTVEKRQSGYVTETPEGPVWQAVEGKYHVVRDDTGQSFGTVSEGYTAVQNREMAEFCEALVGEGGVTCESAGSIRGGEKVWMLLKGEHFAVTNKDLIHPYVLVANGHGGTYGFTVTPTSVRVQCSNTLHLVIGSDHYTAERAAFSFHHTGKVRDKIVAARNALKRFGQAVEDTREFIMNANSREIDQDSLSKFLVEVYSRQVAPIPVSPKDESQVRVRERATQAIAEMVDICRRESHACNDGRITPWIAVNGFTGWLQHRKHLSTSEKAASANLFGVNADRTSAAFLQALQLAS